MNEQAEQIIREFAKKFGTTTEHLWEVLIKQAQITAITDTIIIMLSTIGLLFFLYFFRKKHSKWDEGLKFIACLVLTVYTTAILVIFLCDKIPSVINALLNPEYWALKQLLP